MTTIQPHAAYKRLVTKHETLRWVTPTASLSVRKTGGRFVVRLEDYELQKITKTSYATLPGALVATDNLRNYYL